MKCREGCEGTKVGAQVVCDACWDRLPEAMRTKHNCAACVMAAFGERIVMRIERWLVADDKRRAE